MAKIALILTEGFADWEYALIAGVGPAFYGQEIQFFTPNSGSLQSQGGLTISVTEGLADLVAWRPAAVSVVGGTIWEQADAPDLSALLTSEYQRGCVVAGICGGTLALARAGLLNNVRHTSNGSDYLGTHLPDYQGQGYYQDQPAAMSDQGIITAPGTAPVSYTAALFAAVGLDPQLVAQFKQMMAAEHG